MMKGDVINFKKFKDSVYVQTESLSMKMSSLCFGRRIKCNERIFINAILVLNDKTESDSPKTNDVPFHLKNMQCITDDTTAFIVTLLSRCMLLYYITVISFYNPNYGFGYLNRFSKYIFF